MYKASLFLLVGVPMGVLSDFSIVAIGDWGGEDNEQPTTSSQRKTAEAMVNMIEKLDANFTLMMGDNFYQHGISPDSPGVSSRFRDTFETVYPALLSGGPERPFYALAGNHDYGQDCLANVSAQVAYSKNSKHWHFPSLWYKIHREFIVDGEVRSLDIIVIDTVVLCGNGLQNEPYIDQQLQFLGQQANAATPGLLRSQVAERQWAWLEEALRSSNADYLWVSGHYPIYSAGNDGPTPCLIDRLQPLLEMYGANYISGHDHMLEHVRHKGLEMFVVGAGKECCYPPASYMAVPVGAMQYMLAGNHGRESQPEAPIPVLGGFAVLSFGAKFVSVSFHAHDGSLLYSAPPIQRRSQVMFSLWMRPFVAEAIVFAVCIGWSIGLFWAWRRRRHWQSELARSLLA